MSFHDVKTLLQDRSVRIVNETSRLCHSLLEGSKQDEYISSCTRLMATKYEPMITGFSEQITDISTTTVDLSVQYVN